MCAVNAEMPDLSPPVRIVCSGLSMLNLAQDICIMSPPMSLVYDNIDDVVLWILGFEQWALVQPRQIQTTILDDLQPSHETHRVPEVDHGIPA